MPEAPLEQVLERLRREVLSQADYALLAAALVKGKAVASGSGAVAIAGDAPNATIVTINVAGGDPIAVSGVVLDKLGDAIRRRLPPIFNNLPPVATAFTGRGAEEEAIVASLARQGGAAAISALRGIGGVGKTALAVKIAHRITALFPAAQLLVDLRGMSETPVSPRAAMESVIRRFHPEAKLPDDDAAIGEIYRDLLQKNKCFLILDNARDAAQVAPLLPPSPSAAIVTSRPVLPLAGVVATPLDDLPLPEARTLIFDLVGEERSLSQDELTRLAEACLRHPLSLRVAALFLKTHKGQSVARYIERIEEDRTRLRLEGLPDHDLMAVLGQSVEQLSADDEMLATRWRMLSAFPADFDAAAAAAVWEIASADDATDGLSALEGRGLVEATGEDRYRLHDLLRDLARRDCSKEQATAAALRHAGYFAQVLGTVDRLFQEGGDALHQGVALFDRERTNIMSGQRWAAAGIEASTEAAQLASEYANMGVSILSLRGHPRDWATWFQAALVATRRIGNRVGEGATLGNLGNTFVALGDMKRAVEFYEQSHAIARETGDRRGEGLTLGNIGIVYAELGKTREAIDYYEQHLDIAREIGDRRGEANALGNLGNAFANLGENRMAIELLENVLTIAGETGDRRTEASTLGNLGIIHANLRETQIALDLFGRQLIIRRELGDQRGEANAFVNMGNAVRADDPKSARAYWASALALYTAIEDPRTSKVASWIRQLDDTAGASPLA